ncbi:MAG: hypothetical protein JXR21_00445 [Candidatus Marinimicrobia bacterium]|nr:hypothetical protein [Candidatus Neomarinimicrobiota bacterium]
MLVDAEMQRKDGTWRSVRLWIDSGSPEFFISESLARDLGIDLTAAEDPAFNRANLNIADTLGVRIGGMDLDFRGVESMVRFQPYWLFSTMHTDGNLPSTVLQKYHIIFDYPKRRLTVAAPGCMRPRGTASPASIDPGTGIVQLDAVIAGDSFSFALDMGASYSFITEEILVRLSDEHPEIPTITGTLGCANMWGWWPPREQLFTLVRLPEIQCGNVSLKNPGIVGFPDFSANGPTLGEWYSQKTARPVDGFLGPNVLMPYRVEIDYANSTVYFKKGTGPRNPEMDLVGISLRQLPDLSYQVVGVVSKSGELSVEGLESGDIIVSINGCQTKGKTMGSVVDMLRGKVGDQKLLRIERDGQGFEVVAVVKRFL